jgi:hypothetical protein
VTSIQLNNPSHIHIIGPNSFHRFTVQVLFFFFSRNDPARASAYFRIIEKEAEAAGTVVDPALAEMYLSHMLQLEDPSEALSTLRRLELKHSMQTNRSMLIDHPGQEGPGTVLSGGKLKVGALLYAKVVNVLLRANRTEDAKALIPVLEAKNLTRTYHTVPHVTLTVTVTVTVTAVIYP